MGVTSRLLGILIAGLSFINLALADSSYNYPTSITNHICDEEGPGNREKDSLVLIDFHTQARGSNWFLKWNLTAPMGQWAGITLDANGCVTCIDLDGQGGCSISVAGGNGLSGIISPRLAELQNLEHLYLGNNRLSGKIPEGIFNLPNIKSIDIFANEMIGPLPANIGNAKDLTVISLAGNNMDGEIPPSIGAMTNLEDLFLDNNRLTGPLPSSIGSATNLKTIRLNNNSLSGSIPAEIGMLSALESINMAENNLTGKIPIEVGQLKNLEVFILANNNLTGDIPKEFGELPKLKRLRLCHNAMIGPLPMQLGDLKLLEQLWANDNKLEGTIPAELGKCTNLTDLRLDENELMGAIPIEIAELEFLRKVNLSYNQLIGPLPSNLSKLQRLQELIINDNQLIGPLPEAIGELVSIKIIRANNNNFIGPLPSMISTLTRLKELNLADNEINGNIPDSYGLVPSMDKLNLSNNNLEGCFPATLKERCDMTYLFDNNTKLPWLGDFSQFCQGGQQIGAKCSTETGETGETIQDDCGCGNFECSTINLAQDAYICDNSSISIGGTEYYESGTVTENFLTSHGCDSIITTNVIQVTVDVETQSTSCDNQNNGSAKVETSITGLFNYSLYDAQNNIVQQGNQVSTIPNFENILATGDYRLEILESQVACTIVREFTIEAYNSAAAITEISDVVCENSSISINGNSYNASNTQGTEHMLTAGGCDSTIVIDLQVLSYDFEVQNATCENSNNGRIDCQTNINTDSYSYTILDDTGAVVQEEKNAGSSFQSNADLPTGSYTLLIDSPEFGCNYSTEFSITALNTSSARAELNQVICEESEVIVNGTSYNANNLTGTEFFKNDNGCDSIVDVNLQVLTIEYETQDVICDSADDGQITCKTNLNFSNYNYTLLNEMGEVVLEERQASSTFNSEANLPAGDYSLIIDAPEFGCNHELAITIVSFGLEIEPTFEEYEICHDEELEIHGTVYSLDNPGGDIILSSVNGCDSVINVNLNFYFDPEVSDDQFERNNEDNIFDILRNDLISENADFDITILEIENMDEAYINEDLKLVAEIDENFDGISTVLYEICNLQCNNNCVTARASIVTKGDGYDEDILTPNNDGHNDVLVVTGYSEYEQIPNSKISVINRWGQVVFSTDNYENDWNGTLEGNPNKPLPEGVYYYHLTYNTGKSVMGSRSLIR